MILIGLLGLGKLLKFILFITSSHRETLVAVSDLNSADVDALAKETGGIFEFKKYKCQTIKFLF